MAKNLVIVESPAKAKTISRFLGKDFRVLASMGHVRDLPKSKMGIDVEGDFEPTYEVSADKKKVIKQLKDELSSAGKLWIATDEDREGEAIGWHLLAALKVNPKKTEIQRIVFHEITESAIKEAIAHPRTIDQNVVDAQQARRVLDRLVGYELSPLLWKKVRYGLSAGRVQSVAVRLIVDREREIEAFKPEEYWKVLAFLQKNGAKSEVFESELQKYKGKKLSLSSADQVEEVVKVVKGADYKVIEVEEKQMKRSPAPPFITSTLQQEASRKLGFSVKKTMMVAQQLYEGLDVGNGEQGLITYMRTDSVNLSNLALGVAKEVITKEFGKDYALASPRKYKGKKNAQEAHEAIRPVDLHLKPEMVAKYLDRDQLRLYELIWKRTLACQMAEAVLDRVSVDIEAEQKGKGTGYVFRATGQTVKFPGFMKVYLEDLDQGEESKDGEKFLPKLEVGEYLDLNKFETNQHFTKPPARYTEASLVKKLEQEGIGRPSTYAPTIGTVVARGYVEKEGKVLIPTDLAMLVTDMLVEHFTDIIDYKFTAEMEEKLDQIEEGKKKWMPVIKDFYKPFHKVIVEKEGALDKGDILKERILGNDPKTGLPIVVRHGRFGPFVQLGEFTAEEIKQMEEKPHRASLGKGIYFETVTIEQALRALDMPRNLGKNKEGEELIVAIGRFGPYLKVGTANVSLPKDVDPYDVTLEQALEIASSAAEARKKAAEPIAELGADPESKGMIYVKDGRFGPYITDGKTNVSVSKKLDPKDVTFEMAVEMLAKKRVAPKRAWKGRK